MGGFGQLDFRGFDGVSVGTDSSMGVDRPVQHRRVGKGGVVGSGEGGSVGGVMLSLGSLDFGGVQRNSRYSGMSSQMLRSSLLDFRSVNRDPVGTDHRDVLGVGVEVPPLAEVHPGASGGVGGEVLGFSQLHLGGVGGVDGTVDHGVDGRVCHGVDVDAVALGGYGVVGVVLDLGGGHLGGVEGQTVLDDGGDGDGVNEGRVETGAGAGFGVGGVVGGFSVLHFGGVHGDAVGADHGDVLRVDGEGDVVGGDGGQHATY